MIHSPLIRTMINHDDATDNGSVYFSKTSCPLSRVGYQTFKLTTP